MRPSAGLLLAAALAGVSAAAAAAITVTDDRGQELRLAQPARRIVSLAPHVTELLFAAGAGARLAGVAEASDYPPEARAIARIGGAGRQDLERIARLRPDLVVAWISGNAPGDLAALERLGLPVFATEPRRLKDIPRLVRVLGRLTGNEPTADNAARQFEAELNVLRRRFSEAAPVTVFFQISERPLMTLGDAHIVGDALALCGGYNIFAGHRLLAPTVGVEDVLKADPQIILLADALPGVEQAVRRWRGFPALRAARSGEIHALPADLILRPTPRMLQGVQLLCERLETVRRNPGAIR